MIISKVAPSGFAGGTPQWIKESVFTKIRIRMDRDMKKQYSKIALVGECEDRLTQGCDHDLINIYALVDYDEDDYLLVEIMESDPMPIAQSTFMGLETEKTGYIQVEVGVSKFKKRICFETDHKLPVYFVLGVKN